MATIESIKRKIDTLDAGSFQNLCDMYLSKIGYSNIVSLGAKAGTSKTTKGTPDTYFTTPKGQYIFVEYTTQKIGLFKKIVDDLQKCLDTKKTGISNENIAEIIYCHTSSNITPEQDEQIKKLCYDLGILLTIIGIDRLAGDLYLYHHRIVLDFLGISLSTGQIQTLDDFIKGYNSKKIAAPIDTPFILREQEIGRINKFFENVNIVLLSGSSGAGKTRLALHYADTYTLNSKCYCVHSNDQPIYDDLKIFIDTPGRYFIVVDDANQLSGLQHIIQYTLMQPDGYDVKVLITIRDYAVEKVINEIRTMASYEIVDVDPFSDEEITELLKTSLGILNPDYLDRIVRISEGNARIAVLAGKIAYDAQRLSSIDDASELYEDYFGIYLNENNLANEDNLLISAGIVAFLGAIHLDYTDYLLSVLEHKNMSRDSFIEGIKKLHEMEVLDIYKDKVIRFSEQSLSNFLLKLVFYDRRLLSLSSMVKAFFVSDHSKVVFSINTLLNIFRNDELHNFVRHEILTLWGELAKEGSVELPKFIKAFFMMNPIDTLLILQNKIENIESIQIDIDDLNTQDGRNYINVSDDTIEILSGFADMTDLPAAIDLLFAYYLKRPDLFMEFYHAITSRLGIDKKSHTFGYYTQITLFEKFAEHSNNWQNDFVATLFLEVAEDFLKLWFTSSEAGRRNTIVMHNISLISSDGTESYRRIIWESLAVLSETNKYKGKIREIISSYGGRIDEVSLSILHYDFQYIKSIVENNYPPIDINSCLMAKRISQIFKCKDIPNEELFTDYFNGKEYTLYELLKEPDFSEDFDYGEREEMKKKAIKEYVQNNRLENLIGIIDMCKNISVVDNNNWGVSTGLGCVFDELRQNKENYVNMIKCYLQNDTPFDLNPIGLVNTLFIYLGDVETYELINSFEYESKNAWIYAYFHELPQRYINEYTLNSMYDFLKCSSDKNLPQSSYRSVDFLIKYLAVDKDAFVNGCRIILDKLEYSPFVFKIYFGLSFNMYRNSPQDLIQNFEGNQELLVDIYLAMLKFDSHCDYEGQFLREFYLNSPQILDRYIDHLVENDSKTFFRNRKRYLFFFELDNFLEVFNETFDSLLERLEYPTVNLNRYLESILLPVSSKSELLGKQDFIVRQNIQTSSSEIMKMRCLFEIISILPLDRRISYWLLFFEHNQSFDDFKALPLTPSSYGGTGSLVPVYSSWIDFLEQLLPHFTGIKWLQHKKRVEDHIKYSKDSIEREQINEILRG